MRGASPLTKVANSYMNMKDVYGTWLWDKCHYIMLKVVHFHIQVTTFFWLKSIFQHVCDFKTYMLYLMTISSQIMFERYHTSYMSSQNQLKHNKKKRKEKGRHLRPIHPSTTLIWTLNIQSSFCRLRSNNLYFKNGNIRRHQHSVSLRCMKPPRLSNLYQTAYNPKLYMKHKMTRVRRGLDGVDDCGCAGVRCRKDDGAMMGT